MLSVSAHYHSATIRHCLKKRLTFKVLLPRVKTCTYLYRVFILQKKIDKRGDIHGN